LYYGTDAKVEDGGTAKIGNTDVYKLKIALNSGLNKTEFYDAKTGLLIRADRTFKAAGTEMSISTSYSDYKKAGNILVPYKILQSITGEAGSQEMAIIVKEVKLNAALTAADFK
jgi:zinc protease